MRSITSKGNLPSISLVFVLSIYTQSANFWVIAAAVRDFYESTGALPVPGAVPDMKAQSNVYVELQNIYKAKARKDVAQVVSIVRKTEQSLGRTTPIDE